MVDTLIGVERPATIVVPLGIGWHVDHRVVRSAAERLVGDDLIDPAEFACFEDLPYAVNGCHPAWQDTVAAGLRPCPAPLDDALWAIKLDAVRAYRSQLPPTASLWPDEAAMLRDLRGRREPEHDAPAVEWLWRRPSGRPPISRDRGTGVGTSALVDEPVDGCFTQDVFRSSRGSR